MRGVRVFTTPAKKLATVICSNPYCNQSQRSTHQCDQFLGTVPQRSRLHGGASRPFSFCGLR